MSQTDDLNPLWGESVPLPFGASVWNEIPDDLLAELQTGLEKPTDLRLSYGESFGGSLLQTSNNWAQLNIPETNIFSDAFLDLNQSGSSNNSNFDSGTIADLSVINPLPTITIKTEDAETSFHNNINNNNFKQFNEPQDIVPYEPNPVVQTTLADTFKLHKTQEDHLNTIHQTQKTLSVQDKDNFTQMQQLIFKITQQITNQQKELKELTKKYLLTPQEMYQCVTLSQLLHIQSIRGELARLELQNILDDVQKCLATLVFIEQPQSQIAFKGRTFDIPFKIKLLTSAKTQIGSISNGKAIIVDEDKDVSKASKPIDNNVSEFDRDHICKFSEVKVNISTRMSPINLKFTCSMKDKRSPKEEFPVQSSQSAPVIVITNESQWSEAAGKLLVNEVFQGVNEVTWFYYANYLQKHFINNSGQEFSAPSRGITSWEYKYIHEKFFDNAPKLTKDKANIFWAWFGHVLTTIRFKRHIKTMWSAGFIYGLINKKDCAKLLSNQEPGVFLIRFSDSIAGSFAIAYTTNDNNERVKHYLVKPEDIGANKSLPEFLKERKEFKTILALDLQHQKLLKLKKDEAFKAKQLYSTKRKADEVDPDTIKGYVNTAEQE
mmetsp:Transcript_1183/g.1612  ORF Transcript_1183/g.1612 Transcript_1183/m.1612 type:complete len:605 (+) Transcript_1183:108-1922(+)